MSMTINHQERGIKTILNSALTDHLLKAEICRKSYIFELWIWILELAGRCTCRCVTAALSATY